MVEGRCALSAYATGESPSNGACSPGKHVLEQTPRTWRHASVSSSTASTMASVPATRRSPVRTLRGQWRDLLCHRGAHQPSTPSELLPTLLKAGVRAIKIERPPAQSRLCRPGHRGGCAAIDRAIRDADDFRVDGAWMAELNKGLRRPGFTPLAPITGLEMHEVWWSMGKTVSP